MDKMQATSGFEIVHPDMLIAELNAIGLHFLVGGTTQQPPNLMPADLISELTRQNDARFRTALIALFLFRPDYSAALPGSMSQLGAAHKVNLMLFYTAAVLLQKIHMDGLKSLLPHCKGLPDIYSKELDITLSGDPKERLRVLSKKHREISGRAINWLGTYQHAARRLLSHLEKEASWAV